MKTLLITTGDPDGIGFEVSAKALAKIGPRRGVRFLFFKNPSCEKRYDALIRKKFHVLSVKSLTEALLLESKYHQAIEILTNQNPALCFEEAVKAAKNKKIAAIVTAPLSKNLIRLAGLKDRGHTDIMRRVLKRPIRMAFIGKYFSLILATDHIALKSVSQKLNAKNISTLFYDAKIFLNLLKIPTKKRRVGVLGLNPHAGEVPGMGSEEKTILLPALRKAKRLGFSIEGPLIPDVAFQPPYYKKFSLFIAMYHDQGLIPFKIFHSRCRGAQISLNLPFVRVSVDHGTAKDIFGLNKADPSSMISAIKLALKIV